MQTSETTKELSLALCQFQSAQCKATKKNTNPAFRTKYSSVNDVLESVLPTLTECGLCFVQFPDEEALTTRLMHVSGEWMQAAYTLKPVQATPQASGSAITYARRYALLSILGLGTEDDDAHSASAPAPPSAAQVQAQQTRAANQQAARVAEQMLEQQTILAAQTKLADQVKIGVGFMERASNMDVVTATWKLNPGLQLEADFKAAASAARQRLVPHV